MAEVRTVAPSAIKSIVGLEVNSQETDAETNLSFSAETTPYKSRAERTADALLFSIPNTVIGGLSVMAESIPGVDEEDVEAFRKKILPQALERSYTESREGFETAGTIASMAIPIIGVPKLMQSKAVFNAIEATAGTKAAKLFTTAETSLSTRAARIAEKSKISVNNQFRTVSAESNPLLGKAIQTEYLNAGYDTLKVGLATDATMFAMLNQADFLFPEELLL